MVFGGTRSSITIERAFRVVALLRVVEVRFHTLEILDSQKPLYLFELVIKKVLISGLREDICHRFVAQDLLFEFVSVDSKHLRFKRNTFN